MVRLLLFALLLTACGVRAAPSPAATPTPTYRQITVNHLRNMVEALLALDPLLADQRPADPAWRAEVGMWASQARFAHEMLLTVTPPPASAALHTQVLEATGSCDGALDLVEQGLDASDGLLLHGGGVLLQECYTGFSAAVEALEQSQP